MTYTQKHFRNLFLLKVACIALVAATIILIFSFSVYSIIENKKNEIKSITDLKFNNIKILDDTSISIKDLVLSGKSSKDSNYHLTASEANKNLQGIIEMKDIEFAHSKEGQKDKIIITSDSGLMREEEKLIHIDSIAILRFSDYIVQASKLDIDLKDNTAQSNSAITVTKGNSFLKADRFSTANNSQIIHLNGNVKASINLSDTESR
jgi:LPS export ABC transporter protein LptC